MVKNGKIAPEKSAPECPFECGGGVTAIWAMPTWGWRQVERGFPNRVQALQCKVYITDYAFRWR